jgi:lysophospholipase-2
MATSSHIVAPTAPHTHTIIFLHGRGSDAETFCEELFESEDTSHQKFRDIFPSIKWVFPSASESYAESERENIPQWFDMSSTQQPQEDPEIQKLGLWKSVARILQIVKQEADVVGSRNLIVAGISQGCATAIFALLTSGMRVGGFIGLCGWLPLADELSSIMSVPGRDRDVLKMPVLLQHCQDDDVVPVQNGKDLKERLEEYEVCVKWECFEDGAHWLNEPRGMDGLVEFIQTAMRAK